MQWGQSAFTPFGICWQWLSAYEHMPIVHWCQFIITITFNKKKTQKTDVKWCMCVWDMSSCHYKQSSCIKRWQDCCTITFNVFSCSLLLSKSGFSVDSDLICTSVSFNHWDKTSYCWSYSCHCVTEVCNFFLDKKKIF